MYNLQIVFPSRVIGDCLVVGFDKYDALVLVPGVGRVPRDTTCSYTV